MTSQVILASIIKPTTKEVTVINDDPIGTSPSFKSSTEKVFATMGYHDLFRSKTYAREFMDGRTLNLNSKGEIYLGEKGKTIVLSIEPGINNEEGEEENG